MDELNRRPCLIPPAIPARPLALLVALVTAAAMASPAMAAPAKPGAKPRREPNPQLDVPEPAPDATAGWFVALDIAAASLETELASDDKAREDFDVEYRAILPVALSAGYDFKIVGPIVVGVGATLGYSHWTAEHPNEGLDGSLDVFGAGPSVWFGAWLMELDDVALQLRFGNSFFVGHLASTDPIDVGIGSAEDPQPHEISTFMMAGRFAMDLIIRFGPRPGLTLGIGGAILAPVFDDAVTDAAGETHQIEFEGPLISPVHVQLGYTF